MFSSGSGVSDAVVVPLVGHEDEVPELEEPVAARAGRRAVGLAASVLRAPVVVQLGVGAARPGTADRPEVLGRRQRHDPLRRHADPLPELDRDLVGAELQLRVARVNGHPDAIPVEPHVLEDELRRERDRALLEVLPEREVAEHLEERQVVAVEPDLVDVHACGSTSAMVVSSGAGGGSRPRKYGIIGCIPADSEQRRAVIGTRDERRRRHALVALRLEEREISLAQLCARPHASIVGRTLGRSAAATSSARSCSRWAAASRAVAIASSKFRPGHERRDAAAQAGDQPRELRHRVRDGAR